MHSPAWTVYCDGSASPNPGRIGFGVVLTGPGGECATLSRATPHVGCNNEAELRALMAALQELRRCGADDILLLSDNRIVVDQLGLPPGLPQPAPIARLAALFDEARASLEAFERIRLQWIPRHRNGQADALARAALGLPPKPADRQLARSRRRSG